MYIKVLQNDFEYIQLKKFTFKLELSLTYLMKAPGNVLLKFPKRLSLNKGLNS